jgi:phage protein
MKKFLAFLLFSIFVLGACGNSATSSTTSETSTTQTTELDLSKEENYFDALVSKIEVVNKDNYKSENYQRYAYNTILRDPDKFAKTKLRIDNLKVVQVLTEGKYTKLLVSNSSSDFYMLFIETNRLQTKLLEKDLITVNGRYLFTYDYTTTVNTRKSVPLIYIDAYKLHEKK